MHQQIVSGCVGYDFYPILSVLQQYYPPQGTVVTKTLFFSYISKICFWILQIAFAKKGCFLTLLQNFAAFILSGTVRKYDFQILHSICFATIYNTSLYLENSDGQIFFTKKLVVKHGMSPYLECCHNMLFEPKLL